MENKGVEIMLNATPVISDNFEWSIGYNIAFNDNTITNLPFDQPTGGISGGVGNNVQLHTQEQVPKQVSLYYSKFMMLMVIQSKEPMLIEMETI